MAKSVDSYTRTRLDSANALDEAGWSRLETGGDPFMSRAFLGLAEAHGAAAPELGWRPMHQALFDSAGALAGLLPLYLRTESFGDFSHDWRWAAAWQQAGLAYYPKLVTGAPFTPSPGPRLLHSGSASPEVADHLIDAAKACVAETGASSWQCLFVREADRARLEAAGLLIRRGVQFHWQNPGYRDFDDFLDRFNAEKRKKLKRERRAVAEAGLRIEVRHGDAIDAALWTDLHRHYRDTFHRHGNYPAFSEAFFAEASQALGRRLVVFIAWQNARPVASSICYRDAERLYGRHWGSDIAQPGLHFELCYYSGIEYAIAEGLQRFEPGAQGEHKLARGFDPVPTWSGYWIADPRMRPVVADFLAREANAVADYQAEMARHAQYKAGEGAA